MDCALTGIQIFGVAKGPRDELQHYRIQGMYQGAHYILILQITDETDEGTYVCMVKLHDVLEYMLDHLDYGAPSTLEAALNCIKETFHVKSSVRVESVMGPNGSTPQIVSARATDLGGGHWASEDIRFPPDKQPMKGNLSPEHAVQVRCSITGSLYSMYLAVFQKVEACERNREEYTVAMHNKISTEAAQLDIENTIFLIRKIYGAEQDSVAALALERSSVAAAPAAKHAPDPEKSSGSNISEGKGDQQAPAVRVGQPKIVRGRGPRGRGRGRMPPTKIAMKK